MEYNVVYRKVSDLKPYSRNSKIHDDAQVQKIANSIREFGFRQNLVVDRDGTIVMGHGRWLAAKKLGLDEVPCVIVDDLTEEQIRALRIADNKVSEGDIDGDLLALDLSDIGIDMAQFGFDSLFDDESDEKKQKANRLVEAMQLKQFEHHDYVVFVFKNQMDWLNVLSEFGVENVDAGYGKTRKIGLGRVLDGARLLEKIGYKDSDTEPGQMGLD